MACMQTLTASYVMSSLIFLFSFLWPYFQLITLLIFIWKQVDVYKRSRLLFLFDVTAKFPLFVVFYLMCITNIFSHDLSFTLLQADYTGATDVTLQYGLDLFAVATCMLMLITMLVIYYNDDTFRSKNDLITDQVDEQQQRVRERGVLKCYRPLLFYPQVTPQKVAALLVLLATVGCAIGMYTSPLLVVQFEEGMSDYMDYPQRTYSISNIGAFNMYNFSETTGTKVVLSIIYTIVVVVIPIVILTCLLFLWIIPLPKYWSSREIRYYLWALFCWNGLDVLWIVMVLLVLELPHFYDHVFFSEYSAYCEQYETQLDQTCPDIQLSVGPAFWLCMVTIIGLYVCSHYTVYSTYRDEDDAQPSFPKPTDEHYLAYSEAQPLTDTNADRMYQAETNGTSYQE